jgi:hypothetical protein
MTKSKKRQKEQRKARQQKKGQPQKTTMGKQGK